MNKEAILSFLAAWLMRALGATWSPQSTNFAVYSPEARAMWVCLFDGRGREERVQLTEHTLGVWHGAVPGVPRGQLYGIRAHGPWDPGHGRRFNSDKLLLDPYATAVSGATLSARAAKRAMVLFPLLRPARHGCHGEAKSGAAFRPAGSGQSLGLAGSRDNGHGAAVL